MTLLWCEDNYCYKNVDGVLPEGGDVLGPLHQDQQLLLHTLTYINNRGGCKTNIQILMMITEGFLNLQSKFDKYWGDL